MEISEFEKKRAANLIWSAAENYEISPGFRAFDEEGRADLYWNCIVGSICRHYDWDKLYDFYTSFSQTRARSMYENLFWIAMENAAYSREEKERPVFPYLRAKYAREKLENFHPGLRISEEYSELRADFVLMGHLRHALGRESGLPDQIDQELLAALEKTGGNMDTDQIISHLKEVYQYFFTYIEGTETAKEEKKHSFVLPFLRRKKKKDGEKSEDMGPVRRLAFGYGEHLADYGGRDLGQAQLKVSTSRYASQTDEGLKKYLTTFFGLPMLSEAETRLLTKKLCAGNHEDCHLHITRGEYTKKMAEQQDYAGLARREAIEQEEKNLAAYRGSEAYYRLEIMKLTEKLRNSLLLQTDDQYTKAPAGKLAAERIWRGLNLDDDKIFDKTIPGESGNLTVDILLDASTSQNPRRETVAAQGYVIAESLTRCGIPVRVSSYCSMNGYTILNIFRDYQEVNKNKRIFRYFTAGANRDGLALRLMAELMQKSHADHRILILLTDSKPNDVVKVKSSGGNYQDYAADLAVADTAAEVHAARMKGIQVICIFTGEEEDLPAVQKIYNRDFVRIRSLDVFAEKVGGLLVRQIASL